MKNLLFGCFLAVVMWASAASAASVTLVNKYNQPVKFAISQSSLYNPVWVGVVRPGGKVTVRWPGLITPDFQFMANPPFETSVAYGCGHTLLLVDKLKVVAGMAPWGDFGCMLVTKHAVIYPQQR